MRTEAGKMPESLIFPIGNAYDASNGCFELKAEPCKSGGFPRRSNQNKHEPQTIVGLSRLTLPEALFGRRTLPDTRWQEFFRKPLLGSTSSGREPGQRLVTLKVFPSTTSR